MEKQDSTSPATATAAAFPSPTSGEGDGIESPSNQTGAASSSKRPRTYVDIDPSGAPLHIKSRVLACALCQYRKTKCDRTVPCSNCVKANVACTPGIPAAVRKRRKPTEDLAERLARCEELLAKYSDGTANALTQAANAPPKPTGLPGGPENVQSKYSSKPQSQMTNPIHILGSQNPPVQPLGQRAKMVMTEGTTRLVDNSLFSQMNEELITMRSILESDNLSETIPSGVEDDDDYDAGYIFMGMFPTSTNIEAFQPTPMQIYKLWQIFLERVNPVTQVVHSPSTESLIVEAAGYGLNCENIPKASRALLFAIFVISVQASSEAECMDMFQTPKRRIKHRFLQGLRLALQQARMFSSFDLRVLQALCLYLFALPSRTDPHVAWVVTGMCIRIAQHMGLHRDGLLLKLPPFEVEMRRRIWWHLIIQDALAAIVSGLNFNLLTTQWDTKLPSNINETDISPDSTIPVVPRSGASDMSFVLVTHEMHRMMTEIHTLKTNDGTTDDFALWFAKVRKGTDTLGVRYGIQDSPVPSHQAALIHPVIRADHLGSFFKAAEAGTLNRRETFFRMGIVKIGVQLATYRRLGHLNFNWFFKRMLPFSHLTTICGLLIANVEGPLVDQAWQIIEGLFDYNEEFYHVDTKEGRTFAIFVLKAWSKRCEFLRSQNIDVTNPGFIRTLQGSLTPNPSPQNDPVFTPAASTGSGNGGSLSDLDPFTMDGMDSSASRMDTMFDGDENMSSFFSDELQFGNVDNLMNMNQMGGLGGASGFASMSSMPIATPSGLPNGIGANSLGDLNFGAPPTMANGNGQPPAQNDWEIFFNVPSSGTDGMNFSS